MSKRKLNSVKEISDDSDCLKFIALGGGAEVGRSCHILECKGKKIMLDAGVHPAYDGMAALPFYDEYDLSDINVLLISHFHLDHSASLPYVIQKTNFRGRIFMTHPTKAIYKWLLSDYVRVTNVSLADGQLYDEKDLAESFERIETIDFHSTIEVDGIRITPYHAGHVLGAAMYFIEIAGVTILFTGDYSREVDRHLNIAEVPPEKPDILITESTYGTGSHQPRLEKEARLTKLIHNTVSKGGRVLMPMFALGNTQEILLILDEYWEMHPELHGIPVYYVSALARRCMAVYQTYMSMLNETIRTQFKDRNPFSFRHVTSLRSLDKFDDSGPCVMLASPGMLQNGVSRELFERWCPDSKNSLIIAGFSVEGTMAKQILNEPLEITSLSGQKIPRRMTVDEISFAAHVDYTQNSEFISQVGAKHIILVHGEHNNMGRLKSALNSMFTHRNEEVDIFNPVNGEVVQLSFSKEKIAKTVGTIAKLQPTDGMKLSGVLVQKDFKVHLMDAEDLLEFCGITTTTIVEKQLISYRAGADLLRWHLVQTFGAVDETEDDDGCLKLVVMGAVSAVLKDNYVISVEWEGSFRNDSIADSVIIIIAGIEGSPASVKKTSKSCSHEDFSVPDRFASICMFLESQFGETLTVNGSKASIKIGKNEANINLASMEVECSYEPLRSRIKKVLEYAIMTVSGFEKPAIAIDDKKDVKKINDKI